MGARGIAEPKGNLKMFRKTEISHGNKKLGVEFEGRENSKKVGSQRSTFPMIVEKKRKRLRESKTNNKICYHQVLFHNI